jgi:hypothetical protein
MEELVLQSERFTEAILEKLEELLHQHVGWADEVVSPYALAARRHGAAPRIQEAA